MKKWAKRIGRLSLLMSLSGLAVWTVPTFARRPVEKIKLNPGLRAELNAVLLATVELQEASYKRQDTATFAAMKKLIRKLNSAAEKSRLAKEQAPHMLKILGAAKSFLERSRKATGSDRHTLFQKAFKQLVLIAQVYQLDPYKIFFCNKDKSVWLQRGSKPQNPVNPGTYGDCGKLVP